MYPQRTINGFTAKKCRRYLLPGILGVSPNLNFPQERGIEGIDFRFLQEAHLCLFNVFLILFSDMKGSLSNKEDVIPSMVKEI